MIRGLYTSASAARANEMRMNVLMNNVANVDTTGYKQDRTALRGFQEQLLSRLAPAPGGSAGPLGVLGTGTAAALTTLDLSQGSLVETGSLLDVALQGPGFLVVQTPDGERYTRDGSLQVDANGRLTLADGNLVLGANGPITVGQGKVAIGENGAVTVDGQQVGQLRIVECPAASLRKVGGNYLAATDPAAVQNARQTTVSSGYLEGSNVDATATTIEMMEATRAYGAAQEMLRLQDEVLGRTVSEVGRVGG